MSNFSLKIRHLSRTFGDFETVSNFFPRVSKVSNFLFSVSNSCLIVSNRVQSVSNFPCLNVSNRVYFEFGVSNRRQVQEIES